MAFEFRDEMITQYLAEGFLILRGILPGALVRDLRRECDKARAMAHELHGPQAQRIQPVDKYAERLDQRPFSDYCELPELRDAIAKLLGPGYTHGHRHIMGILVEPKERPWTLGWHRDAVVEVPPAAYDAQLRATLAAAWHDLRHYNQVNCAIYADSSLWFVPGSHLRQHDLPGERQTVGDAELKARLEPLSNAEAERACLEHCLTFPGAVQVHLMPGDYMVYRQLAWHNGCYAPYQPRATIHDIVSFAPDDGWGKRWRQAKEEAVARMRARAEGGVMGAGI